MSNQPTHTNSNCNSNSNSKSIPIIRDPALLQKYGIIKAPISSLFDRTKWATELSQCTPMNLLGEGDDEYVFYRNILEEPEFPFALILESEIGKMIQQYFVPKENSSGKIEDMIRLDDAFCIHYNMNQSDTSCGRHMDPSDITVNLCLECEDVQGSEVLFYGTQRFCQDNDPQEENHIDDDNNNEEKDEKKEELFVTHNEKNDTKEDLDSCFQFLVEQEPGYATIHFGAHAHETMPLRRGKRTNLVFTYWYKDETKSEAAARTCFF